MPPNTVIVYHVKFENILLLSEEIEKIDQYIVDKNMTVQIDPEYGTRYEIHRVGNGISPETGASITTHYQLELLDSTIVQSSFEAGVPFSLTYKNVPADVIPGFEMGLTHLHENDSATIFVPSIYGYKDATDKEGIPANSVLIFILDITRISNPF